MSASNRAVFAALAVALAAGVWLAVEGSPGLTSESPAGIRSAARIEGGAAAAASGGTAAANAAASRSPEGAVGRSASFTRPVDSTAIAVSMIRHRFETSPDYRALFDELQRSGVAEGRFFAAKMLGDCVDVGVKGLDTVLRDFIASVPADSPHASARIAAFRRIKEPCAGFSGRRTDAGEIGRLNAEGAAMGDVRALSRMLAGGVLDPALDPLAVMTRLLESGDPYALHNVAMYLSDAARGPLVVDGKPVDAADFDAAQMAWDLVACDHGWPCGPHSEPVLNMCAHDSLCNAQTFEELVRTELGILASFERVQHFRSRILAALARKDYGSLGIVSAKAGK